MAYHSGVSGHPRRVFHLRGRWSAVTTPHYAPTGIGHEKQPDTTQNHALIGFLAKDRSCEMQLQLPKVGQRPHRSATPQSPAVPRVGDFVGPLRTELFYRLDSKRPWRSRIVPYIKTEAEPARVSTTSSPDSKSANESNQSDKRHHQEFPNTYFGRRLFGTPGRLIKQSIAVANPKKTILNSRTSESSSSAGLIQTPPGTQSQPPTEPSSSSSARHRTPDDCSHATDVRTLSHQCREQKTISASAPGKLFRHSA